MGLDDASPIKTPAEYGHLSQDQAGEGCNTTFNYASIVEMIMYLQGHSRPKISFAVSPCASYTFNPRLSHETALKLIRRYLKGTRTREFILSLSADLTINCYVDSNFSELWSYEDYQDLTCVRSRTSFIMIVANCPGIWSRKLQTEITLYNMEAECIDLSTTLNSRIPLKRLVRLLV